MRLGISQPTHEAPLSTSFLVARLEPRDVLRHLSKKHLLLPVIKTPVVCFPEWFEGFPIKVPLVVLLRTLGQFSRPVDGVVLGGPLQHVLFALPATEILARGGEDSVLGLLKRVDRTRRS